MLHFLAKVLLAGVLPLLSIESTRAADAESAGRASVEKGLAFLAKDAVSWKQKRKCASCHHAPMGLWSLNEAKKQGYAVDEKAVAELTAWVVARDDPAKIYPKLPQKETKEPNVNQAPLLLALGVEAGDLKDDSTRQGLAKMLSTVLTQQRPDGSWRLQSLTQPIGAAPDVITSFSLLSLVAAGAPDLGQPVKEAREKGLKWLSSEKPGDELESGVARLLLLRRLGRPAAQWQAAFKQIVGKQNPDGGWSQLKGMASDAFATGQALYVLVECGLQSTDPVVAKARAFLAKSQGADGSWPMTSRPKERDNKSSKDLKPISFAATAWAVMALARSEPRTARRLDQRTGNR